MVLDALSASVLILACAVVYTGARLARSIDACGVQLSRVARAVLGDEGGQSQKATVPATAHLALERAQERARRAAGE